MAIKKIPCGGFYVDDGAVQNVDGKPVLSAWNADLPKPSVGGYGYTESGEQTVITWNGDTEGHYSVSGMYMVSEETPSQDSLVGAVIELDEGVAIEVTADKITPFSDTIYAIVDRGFPVCMVATEQGDIQGAVVNKGTYFIKEGSTYVSSLTYGTPDTIHKIDEKYLPASGGAMVVEVDYDGEQFVSTKTVDEVKEAMLTMPVIGIAKLNGEFFGVGIFSWLFDGGDSGFDDNTPVVTASMYKSVEDVYQFVIQPIIGVADGEFVVNA